MFGSIWKSYTGIVSNSTALNVTGNNLANMNTVGFKRSSADFHTLMTNIARNSGNGNPIQIGLGSHTAAISPVFSQGNLTETGRPTNVALQGNGFFMVNRGANTHYTRAGNFVLNSAGQLVTPDGSSVQGYTSRDESGNIITNGAVTDITVDFEEFSEPRRTQLVRYVSNLNPTSEPGEVVASEIDIFDGQGEARTLTLRFTKTDTPGVWDYEFELEGGEVANGTGRATFHQDGTLATLNGQDVSDPNFTNPVLDLGSLDNGAPDFQVTWDVVQVGAGSEGANKTLITNYNADSIASTVFQDGAGIGELESVGFNQDGVLVGTYTNGEIQNLAQLAIAFFNNNEGLKQTGNGLFSETTASGAATLNPNSGTRFLGNTVETSNVDVATEFVDLIFHQRAYQGNTRSVNTSNQILQEILGLKR